MRSRRFWSHVAGSYLLISKACYRSHPGSEEIVQLVFSSSLRRVDRMIDQSGLRIRGPGGPSSLLPPHKSTREAMQRELNALTGTLADKVQSKYCGPAWPAVVPHRDVGLLEGG